ncbi:MAG: tRNA pseudouridine(38-40) synthase TruA [Dehalococcoidia bacterium]|nr:tRNA pseudouridine(38-40) synthase TruA [Dehalococcoidia bacterium]
MKIALVVEYFGKHYHGFEWQNGLPTIQGKLEEAILRTTGEQRRVIAASRTDAGVHAKGQVVSFWTDSRLSIPVMQRALNAHLPEDIAVLSAHQIPENFSVRGDAVSRQYNYLILNRPCRSPLVMDISYFVARKLDVETMNEACRLLIGEHDLSSFVTSWQDAHNPVRTIFEARIERAGDMLDFKIVASSFLPHQVRNTVGLLVRVGLGSLSLTDFKRIIEARRPGLAGPRAPARGLCLTKINYNRPLGE